MSYRKQIKAKRKPLSLKRMLFYKFVIFIVVSLQLFSLQAQDIIELNSSQKFYQVLFYSSFFIDKNNRYKNLEEIKASPPPFQKASSANLSFGYNPAEIWLKFSFLNSSSAKKWLLKLDAHEQIFLYLLKLSGEYEEIILERAKSYDNIPRRGGYFYLSLPTSPYPQTVYLKIKHNDAIILHTEIVDMETALQVSTEDMVSIFYAGLIGFIALYNFFLFLLLKNKSYFYYIAYISNMLLLQLVLDGRFLGFFANQSFLQTENLETITIALAMIFYILFAKSFLTCKDGCPHLNRILNFICILLLFHLPTVFFIPFWLRTASLSLLVTLTICAIFILLIIRLKQKYKPARFFISAWLALSLGIIIFILRNLAIIPNIFFTEYSLQIGSSLEAVLLSFALAFRIDILQKEREEALAQFIDEHRRAEKLNRNYETLFQTAPLGIALIDLDGKYLAVNRTFCEMYEYSSNELIQARLLDSVFQSERQLVEQKYLGKLIDEASQTVICFERTNLTSSGKRLNVRYYVTSLKNEEGKPSSLLCCVEDVTAYKNLVAELNNSLRQKNILLKEIHHRVKNNLQIILSLFHLKARDLTEPRLKQFLKITSSRIHAIANVHSRLYLSPDFSAIEAPGFIESTAKQTLANLSCKKGQINFKFNVANFFISLEEALPLALILNELIINAVFHALTPEKPLTITIIFKELTSARTDMQKAYLFQIEDDGKGFGENFSLEADSGFGLNLVFNLVEQIGGSISFEKKPCTCFKISFTVK